MGSKMLGIHKEKQGFRSPSCSGKMDRRGTLGAQDYSPMGCKIHGFPHIVLGKNKAEIMVSLYISRAIDFLADSLFWDRPI